MPRRLLEIYEDIATRTTATQREHGYWPCKKGCSNCCERLSREPDLTKAEWDHLRAGIEKLDPSTRVNVEEAIRQLTRTKASGHVICPLLERAQGVCLVYEHRPAACRTYGFFARREDILGCQLVVEATRDQEGVVWGNHERIEHDLGELAGASRPLTEWWVESQSAGQPGSVDTTTSST